MGACVDLASGHKRRRTEIVAGDWVSSAVLLCEKFSYFRLRRVPGAVLAMPCMGGAGRGWGASHEMGIKKSLTTGRHASRLHFDAGG